MNVRWKVRAIALVFIAIACGSGDALEGSQDGGQLDRAAAGSAGSDDASAGGSDTGGAGGAAGHGGRGTDGGSFDAGQQCPTLLASPCWQALMAEYVAVASCFGHRSKCDRSGTSGDASECGSWTDPSRTVCTWPDGSEVRRMGLVQTISGPSKTECYKRDYSEPGASYFIFDNRTYILEQRGTITAVTCPGGTSVEAPSTEVSACGPNGICCSSATPPVCELFPL